MHWECEHGGQARRHRRRREPWKSRLYAEVRHHDRLPRLIRADARTFPDVRLQLLEPQRRVIGRGHIARRDSSRNQRDARRRYRQHLNDSLDEMIEDPLNRKVRAQGAGKLAQHRRQRFLAHVATRRRQGGRVVGSPTC